MLCPTCLSLVNACICLLQVSSYSVEIHAVDSGSPQLTGKTLLHIELLDVNDSPPRLSQHNYTAVIQVIIPPSSSM